jgi:hypothetical protein
LFRLHAQFWLIFPDFLHVFASVFVVLVEHWKGMRGKDWSSILVVLRLPFSFFLAHTQHGSIFTNFGVVVADDFTASPDEYLVEFLVPVDTGDLAGFRNWHSSDFIHPVHFEENKATWSHFGVGSARNHVFFAWGDGNFCGLVVVLQFVPCVDRSGEISNIEHSHGVVLASGQKSIVVSEPLEIGDFGLVRGSASHFRPCVAIFLGENLVGTILTTGEDFIAIWGKFTLPNWSIDTLLVSAPDNHLGWE